MRRVGLPASCGSHTALGMIGRNTRHPIRTTKCTPRCQPGEQKRLNPDAYAYPSRRTIWKNSMQVVHTPDPPPNQGRMYLPMSGCTENNRNALRKMVAAYRNMPG